MKKLAFALIMTLLCSCSFTQFQRYNRATSKQITMQVDSVVKEKYYGSELTWLYGNGYRVNDFNSQVKRGDTLTMFVKPLILKSQKPKSN